MTVETQYNIVKVNELREITVAQGVDQLIINDLDSSPLETKKITAENLALSLKDYILPIATDDVLGGVKIGHGLTINPITGVLSNDINILDDLGDVIILNPEVNQVLRYNGVQWINQSEGGFTNIIAGEGLSGGGTEGVITLNVNAGPGLRVQSDQVWVNAGGGLAIEDDYLVVQVSPGLVISQNNITLNLGEGLVIQDQLLVPNPGNGIYINGGKITALLGDGLTFGAEGRTTIDYARGLTIVGGKLECNIGSGLKFTGSVLEGNATLPELNDVSISNPTDDQILQYNGLQNQWENVDVATLSLADLKSLVANAADYSEFQAAIGAL
jgi:hypothetical protein